VVAVSAAVVSAEAAVSLELFLLCDFFVEVVAVVSVEEPAAAESDASAFECFFLLVVVAVPLSALLADWSSDAADFVFFDFLVEVVSEVAVESVEDAD
jgi:hypothetical protein